LNDDADKIWRALADPTRRAILDLLRDGPRTTTDIVEAVPRLSRFGVMKHLDVLKRCGLVLVRADGRRRVNSLNAAPIRRIYERWVRRYEGRGAGELLSVKRDAERRRHDEKLR
jgi:DNA-binding transcriptional ArsR family regulator